MIYYCYYYIPRIYISSKFKGGGVMKVSRLITPGRGKGLIQGIGYILFINKIVHYLTSLHVAKHEFSASQLTLDALP